eukprot:c7369_g1_i1.p1 GENE.c7369_g1_i1~~c7369_g1_i1.p1  ORF type:complete len:184 (-),score=49.69 c7369_g1_i1:12-563(-)
MKGNRLTSHIADELCVVFDVTDTSSPSHRIGLVLCQYSRIPDDSIPLLAQLIQSNLPCKRAVIYAALPEHTVHAEDLLSCRMLATDVWRQDANAMKPLKVPFLEPPTVVDGLAAALLTLFQLHCVRSVAFVAVQLRESHFSSFLAWNVAHTQLFGRALAEQTIRETATILDVLTYSQTAQLYV